MRSVIESAILVVLLSGFGLVMLSDGLVTAQKRPLFAVGETIGIVTGCMPAQFAPPGTNPCFTENFVVKEVLGDGWLRVLGEDENEWIVNTAQVYAFRRLVVGAAAE